MQGCEIMFLMFARNTSILLAVPPSAAHTEAVMAFCHLSPAQQNIPDLHFTNTEDVPLTIEAARQMTQDMQMHPYQSDKSTFVIFHIDRASVPAQNALLKSLEEPPAHVQIILTSDRPDQVLSTIQSRCQTIKVGETTEGVKDTQEVQELVKALQISSHGQAITLAEKYKERSDALKIVQDLLFFLHAQNQQSPRPQLIEALQTTLNTQGLLEKNVNVRLAMEELFFKLKELK